MIRWLPLIMCTELRITLNRSLWSTRRHPAPFNFPATPLQQFCDHPLSSWSTSDTDSLDLHPPYLVPVCTSCTVQRGSLFSRYVLYVHWNRSNICYPKQRSLPISYGINTTALNSPARIQLANCEYILNLVPKLQIEKGEFFHLHVFIQTRSVHTSCNSSSRQRYINFFENSTQPCTRSFISLDEPVSQRIELKACWARFPRSCSSIDIPCLPATDSTNSSKLWSRSLTIIHKHLFYL